MKKTVFVLVCFFPLFLLHAQQSININELSFLVGEWNVEVESRLSIQGPWEKSQAKSVIRKTLNNTIIEEEFTGTRQEKPFFIKALFGVNNGTNQFQKTFSDSEHGVLVLYEGVKKNDTLYLNKEWVYTNGNSVILRTAYYILSPDEFWVESMRMPKGTSTWEVTGKMRYTRK